MIPDKYPDDIGLPAFRNRRITINVYSHFSSTDAKAAKNYAKKILGDVLEYVPAITDTVDEYVNNIEENLKRKSSTKGELKASITLPLPNIFQDSQSHGWTNESGIIGTIGQSLTSIDVGAIAGKALGGLGSGLTADKIVGAAASSFGVRKPIIDPGYFQNYTGSEPRSFTTEFNFIPSSRAEAESILSIIMKLKQFSSPQRSRSVFLLAPHFFEFKFDNGYINALVKMGRVVLTSIAVDYGADGSMQMTGDGIPKFMTLNLTWQEVDLTTSYDYSHVPSLKESS
jgi:hypothetical protein